MSFDTFKFGARLRSENAVSDAAKSIGVEKAALEAVIAVEAADSGFDKQGRPKALFEPHKFWIFVPKTKQAEAHKKGLAYPTWGEKPYPKDSYPRILDAIQIDSVAALRATSWGVAQIMGFNHLAAGFATVENMVEAFGRSEDAQIKALANFIRSNRTMHQALKDKDWAAFAENYNGKRFRENRYDEKLKAAYIKAINGRPKGLLKSKTAGASASVVVVGGIPAIKDALEAARQAQSTAADAWQLIMTVGPCVAISVAIVGLSAYIIYERCQKMKIYGI